MRDADLVGPAAWLWECVVDNGDPAPSALATYLIFAPGAHPLWSWHLMSIIHLRPTEKHGEAHIQFPGATHEVLVIALKLDPDDFRTWRPLMPSDVCHQVMLPSDEEAVLFVAQIARAVSEGMLIPDSDWRERWAGILNRTAEHSRLGGHPS